MGSGSSRFKAHCGDSAGLAVFQTLDSLPHLEIEYNDCCWKCWQGGGGWWVLVKGSPEAIGARLAAGQRPVGYDDRAAALAKGGMRVLALAYKCPKSDAEGKACEESRALAEKDLLFAGFVAFSCRVRKDTRKVVLQLREGAHDVVMVTGDAILTAVHVAIEVSIHALSAWVQHPFLFYVSIYFCVGIQDFS